MKLVLDRLPASLSAQRLILEDCIRAMDGALPIGSVYLFGSHPRGEARPDSDVDLCIIAEGATRQLEAAQCWRRAMRPLRGKPSFTLIPITPARLREKQAVGDHFFETVLREGVLMAAKD